MTQVHLIKVLMGSETNHQQLENFARKAVTSNASSVPYSNVRGSGVFFPTTEMGFNMKNFNIYGNSCMRLCDKLKRNSLIFNDVIQPLVDEKI